MQRAAPRIWPHREVRSIHIAQRVEPQHRRIHPTVHRNIRAAIGVFRWTRVNRSVCGQSRVGNLRRRLPRHHRRRGCRLRSWRGLRIRHRMLRVARHRLDLLLPLRRWNRCRRRICLWIRRLRTRRVGEPAVVCASSDATTMLRPNPATPTINRQKTLRTRTSELRCIVLSV